ncbi:MAG: hypothetical protein M3R04_06275, partial [bacterium]|nr:hypothetical protein [bacterium]
MSSHKIFSICFFLLSFFLLSCSHRAGQETLPGKSDAGSYAELAAQIDALPVPKGVTTEDWAKMTTGLKQVLASRSTSAAAQGRRPDDFEVTDAGSGNATARWSYRNAGDYDLNGEVSVSDLSALGLGLGAVEGQSRYKPWVDGNSDGLIGIADLTPLGSNLQARVTGYRLQAGTSATGPWQTVETFNGPFSRSERSEFSVGMSAAQQWYRVVPLDGSTGLGGQTAIAPLPGGAGGMLISGAVEEQSGPMTEPFVFAAE